MADSKFTAEENEFLDNAKDRGVTDAGQLAILLKQFQMKQRTQMPLPDATIPDLEKIGAEPKTKQPFMTNEQKMKNLMRRTEKMPDAEDYNLPSEEETRISPPKK